MKVQAQKSRRRARKLAVGTAGNGMVAQVERDKDVQQLVAADAQARTADHQVKVALAAYFIAEKRGFEPGHELDDWLEGESEIAEAERPQVTKPIQMMQSQSLS